VQVAPKRSGIVCREYPWLIGMSKREKHAPDEFEIGESLVRRLPREQFPRWGDLPLRRIEPGGTANVIFRLGDELSLRLPRRDGPRTSLDISQLESKQSQTTWSSLRSVDRGATRNNGKVKKLRSPTELIGKIKST